MQHVEFLKMKMHKTSLFLLSFFLCFILSRASYAQTGKIKMSGIVFSEVTEKPVPFASIAILELKVKVRADENGNYTMEIPKPGSYTLIVNGENLKPLQEKIEIRGDLQRNFSLGAIQVTGRSLTIRGSRDIQKISRNTLSSDEVKAVPAGFGDIIQSLRSMPGITSRGIFGSIIMRGANPSGNFYCIDNIPILDPRHFLGLHTIISSDAISEVDVFSSSSPSQYGFSNAAVISMNTLDDVKKTGAVVNAGLISANAIVKGPFESVVNGKPENKGYWFVSGRAGYLSLLFPVFNEVLKSPISQLPEYYDYQAKLKYYFNGKHALRVFAMGTFDKYNFNPSPEAKAQLFKERSGGDPLNPLTGVDARYSFYAHNQAIYHEFKPGEFFSNTVMIFSSFNNQHNDMIMTYGNGTADISKHTSPNMYGLKNDLAIKWLKEQNTFKIGLEYYYFDFKSTGVDIVPLRTINQSSAGMGVSQIPNFSDPAQFELRRYSKAAANQAYGGHVENTFKFGGLTIVPGFRLNHLKLNKEIIWDPRGLISYEFNTGTTISLAGGKYSQFMQTNLNYFENLPVIAVTPNYISEKAIHSVFGIEQKFQDFSIKGEIYFNYFYDMAQRYNSPTEVDPYGDPLTHINSGKAQNYGFEILLRKLDSESVEGLFGWVSYTLTQAKFKPGVPGLTNSEDYYTSSREETHSVKTVAGYRANLHTISGKLSFNTSFPYTEIIADDGDPRKMGRYGPVYSDTPNTGRFDPALSLDLRYTYAKPQKWGEISFYFELINVLGLIYKPRDTVQWRYNQRFAKGENPKLVPSSQALPIIPNFGVEAKF